MTKNPIIDALADPNQLEKLYEQDSKSFQSNLIEALDSRPEVPLLKFWKTRLEYRATKESRVSVKELSNVLLICLVAFLAVRIPVLMSVEAQWYYPRFAPIILFTGLIFYILKKNSLSKKVGISLAAGILIVVLPMMMLPNTYESSSIVMAIIHMPLVMWVLLGLAFTGDYWKSSNARLNFIRANGEVFIYSTLILLGGIVLTGLTLGLFQLINVEIGQWYLNNVVIAGVISAPILAAYVYVDFMKSNSRIAVTISNIFAPLFLVTTVAYLIVMVIQQISPFTNREFLILFNGLLVIVLGMTIYSICGRKHDNPSHLMDAINVSLICVTLIINVIALAAILYRFSEWGMSPNRVVVLGANLLIFGHLGKLLSAYWQVYNKRTLADTLKIAVTGYFPIYGAWALFVVVVLPLVFSFR